MLTVHIVLYICAFEVTHSAQLHYLACLDTFLLFFPVMEINHDAQLLILLVKLTGIMEVS